MIESTQPGEASNTIYNAARGGYLLVSRVRCTMSLPQSTQACSRFEQPVQVLCEHPSSTETGFLWQISHIGLRTRGGAGSRREASL